MVFNVSSSLFMKLNTLSIVNKIKQKQHHRVEKQPSRDRIRFDP